MRTHHGTRSSWATRGALVVTFAVSQIASPARAEKRSPQDVRVIVHPSNRLDALSRTFLTEAFLKKTTQWPGGDPIQAVDQRFEAPVRRRFSEAILSRSVAAVRSYWQQRIFTGRDLPPPEVESDEAVTRYVASHRGAVGYVSGAAATSGVREVSTK